MVFLLMRQWANFSLFLWLTRTSQRTWGSHAEVMTTNEGQEGNALSVSQIYQASISKATSAWLNSESREQINIGYFDWDWGTLVFHTASQFTESLGYFWHFWQIQHIQMFEWLSLDEVFWCIHALTYTHSRNQVALVPFTTKMAEVDRLSTSVSIRHTYFPPWLSWMLRIIRSPETLYKWRQPSKSTFRWLIV